MKGFLPRLALPRSGTMRRWASEVADPSMPSWCSQRLRRRMQRRRKSASRAVGEGGTISESVQQVPRRWHWLHHPETQNAQVRRGQNEQGDRNPELCVEERAEVWSHVAQQEPRGFAP